MASLGELFYEAGVRVSGIKELEDLEKKLLGIKENSKITLDVSSVNILKELGQNSIKAENYIRRLGNSAMSVKDAFADAFGKGNTYKEATKELDRILDRQKLLESSLLNLKSIGSNAGLASNYATVTKALQGYIDEYTQLGKSMKAVMNEAGKDNIGPNRYRNIMSQITGIESLVNELGKLKTAYDEAMRTGTSVGNIRDTVFKAFLDFPNGLKQSLAEVAVFEQKFMSAIYNMGKNASPAMKEVYDEFRKTLSKSYSGFDLGAITIQEVWVKNITPERGAVRQLRDRIYEELKELPIAVNVQYGTSSASTRKSGRKASSADAMEPSLISQPTATSAANISAEYAELRAKALRELTSDYKQQVKELDDLGLTVKEKLAKLKSIYKTGKEDMASQKPVLSAEDLASIAAKVGINISEITKQAEASAAVTKEVNKTVEAETKVVTEAVKATEAMAKQEEQVRRTNATTMAMASKMGAFSRSGIISEATRIGIENLEAKAFPSEGGANTKVMTEAVKELQIRLEGAKKAFDELSAGENLFPLKRSLLDVNAQLVKASQHLTEISKQKSIDPASFMQAVRDAETAFARASQVYGTYDRKTPQADAILAIEKQTEAVRAETKASENNAAAAQSDAKAVREEAAAVETLGMSAQQTASKLNALQAQWSQSFTQAQVRNIEKVSKYMDILNNQDKPLDLRQSARNTAKIAFENSIKELSAIKEEFGALASKPVNAPFANEFAKLNSEATVLQEKISKVVDTLSGWSATKVIKEDFSSITREINQLIGIANRFREIMTTPVFNQGIIDLRGPGTSVSDSIKAFLSVGESVISAETTKMFRQYLHLFEMLGNNVSIRGMEHKEAVGWVTNVASALANLNNIAPNEIFKVAIQNLMTIGELTEKDRLGIINLLNDASKATLRLSPEIARKIKDDGSFYASRYTRPGYDDFSYLKGQKDLRQQIAYEQALAVAAENSARQLEARQRAMALGSMSGRQIFSGITDVSVETNQLNMLGNAIEYLKQKLAKGGDEQFFRDLQRELNATLAQMDRVAGKITGLEKTVAKTPKGTQQEYAKTALELRRMEYQELSAKASEYQSMLAGGANAETNALKERINTLSAAYDNLASKINAVREANSGVQTRINDLNANKDAVVALAKEWDALIASNRVYDGNGAFTREALDVLDRYAQLQQKVTNKTQTLAEAQKKRVSQKKESEKQQAKEDKNLDALKGKYTQISNYLSTMRRQKKILNRLGLETKNTDNVIAQYERLLAVLKNIMASGDSGRVSKALSRINGIMSTGSTVAVNAGEWDKVGFSINGATGAVISHRNALKDMLSQTFSMQNQFQQLGMTIQNTFSVIGLQQFASEIIRIGGEIEKQKLAMGSILGGNDKAEVIYGQLSQLSMYSPFTVEDVMKYSKQLAAFGIEYDHLFETTKRLADIAAGVGVDFGRIAYEFGQTSSRGWLDARELRMFANSGIPLLQKLSEHYSKLRDEMVSTSQVREMISKREVGFEDVKQVLWEMTDAGGAFYKMQEVMAESLAAKYANLENARNLMLASIAEDSGIGNFLKDLATVLTVLTEKWRYIIPQVGAFVAALIAIKTATFLSKRGIDEEILSLTINTNEHVRASLAKMKDAIATGSLSEQQAILAIRNGVLGKSFNSLSNAQKRAALVQMGFSKGFARASTATFALGGAIKGVTNVLRSLKYAFMSSWPLLAITAAISAITALVQWMQERNRLQKELNQLEEESRAETERTVRDLQTYSSKLKDSNLSLDERAKIIDNLKSHYGEYLSDLNEEADVQQRIAEATAAINKNARLKLQQDKINKVRESFSEKKNEYSNDLLEALQDYYGKNSITATTLHAEFMRLAEDGNQLDLGEIARRLPEMFRQEIDVDWIASRYLRTRDKEYAEIQKIENDQSGVTLAERRIQQIEEYWNNINQKETSSLKKVQNRVKMNKQIVEMLTAGKDEEVEILGGDQAKMVSGLGDLYDASSEIVRKYQGELDKAEEEVNTSWRNIASTVIDGVNEINIEGEKVSVEPIKEKLMPMKMGKESNTEYFKRLAEMYKETAKEFESETKLMEKQKGIIDPMGFSLWQFSDEKNLSRLKETKRLLEELEEALGLSYEDINSSSKNSRSKKLIDEIQNLKKAYDEYKKFAGAFGHKTGLEMWTKTDRYKREFSDLKIDDIVQFREKLESAYEEASKDPKLKEAASRISDIIIQFDLDFTNKSIEQSVSKLKDKLDDDIKRFDFFDKLVAAGFSNEQAYKIALDGIEKGIANSVASGIRQGARQSLSSVVQAFKISNTDTKTEKVEVAKFVPKKNKDFVLMMYPLVTAELKKRSYVKPEEVDEYARMIISQLADESGWGRSLLSSGYNNFGGHKPGIKPVKHVTGKVWMDNKQKNDGSWYNVYDSIEGFLEDHIDYVNRKFNAFEKGVDMYMKQLQENPRYQDPNTGKQKQMYATVDLHKGKGTYEKYVRAIMKHVNKALQEGGVAEFEDKTFTEVLKDKANLAVSDKEIDEIFTMSESQIRERYGEYADNIIKIVGDMSSEIESRVKGIRFDNAGEYLKANIEAALWQGVDISKLRYLDAEGLQSFVQDNSDRNVELSKVQAQNLKGYIDEYLKYQDKVSSSVREKFADVFKDTESYLGKRSAVEAEYAKILADIDYLSKSETDEQARKTLELQKQVVQMQKIRDLAKVDYEQWQKTPEVRFALENLSNVPAKVLDGLGDALKSYLSDAIASGDQGTARDIAGKLFDVLDVEAVRRPFEYLNQTLIDSKKVTYQAAKVEENLAKKERDRIIASNASASEKAAAEERLRQASAKVAASEEALYRAMKNREKAMEALLALMDKMGELGNSLKELGNSIGGGVGKVLGYAGDSLDLFGDMKKTFSSFAESSKKGESLWKGVAWAGTVSSIIGMVTGYANLLKKLGDAVSNVQYGMYERAAQKQREINAMVDAVYAYKKAVIEARQEEENWFGGATSHKSIRDASEGLKATADKYDAIMEEKTEKYVNKSGKGWGAYLAAGLVAVAGVVAAIYTGGSSLAAAGGAVGAILAGAAGAATATAVGVAAILTASAAAGSLIAAGVDAAIQASKFNSEKISAYKNLVIETRKVSKGFWGTGWGGHDQQTMDLQKWLDQVGQISKAYAKLKKGQMSESEYDAYVKRTAQSKHSAEMQKKFAEELYRAGIDNTNLFDEWGMINIELANAILENETLSGKLMGDTKETMEKLVETAEEWKEYTDQIKEAVSEMFSPLIDNMVDAVWDWFDNGADALDSFRNKASDTFREIASDMLRTMMQKQVFQKYADQLNNLFIAWGAESIDDNALTTQMAAISGAMLGEVEKLMPMWEKWLELTDQAIKSAGFENGLTSSSDTSTASNGIKGVTEETADIITAYINGMRLDLSVQRSVVEKIYELMLAKSGMKLEDGEYVPFEELESSSLPVPQEMLESIKEPMLYNNLLMESIALEQLPTFNAIAESQLAQLNMITENTRIGAEYAQMCAGYAEEMRDLFRDVTTGIKKVSVE